jgi:hypothetical protein
MTRLFKLSLPKIRIDERKLLSRDISSIFIVFDENETFVLILDVEVNMTFQCLNTFKEKHQQKFYLLLYSTHLENYAQNSNSDMCLCGRNLRPLATQLLKA